jgi:hypothetical protein
MNNARISKELNRLAAANNGLLLPEHVIEAARPKRSILHSKFEWDDTTAAHEYRLWQARHLISISITIEQGIKTQEFISLRSERRTGGGYRTTVSVMSNEEWREQSLRDALMELNCFQQKYSRLRELAGVFAAIGKARRKAA